MLVAPVGAHQPELIILPVRAEDVEDPVAVGGNAGVPRGDAVGNRGQLTDVAPVVARGVDLRRARAGEEQLGGIENDPTVRARKGSFGRRQREGRGEGGHGDAPDEPADIPFEHEPPPAREAR